MRFEVLQSKSACLQYPHMCISRYHICSTSMRLSSCITTSTRFQVCLYTSGLATTSFITDKCVSTPSLPAWKFETNNGERSRSMWRKCSAAHAFRQIGRHDTMCVSQLLDQLQSHLRHETPLLQLCEDWSRRRGQGHCGARRGIEQLQRYRFLEVPWLSLDILPERSLPRASSWST